MRVDTRGFRIMNFEYRYRMSVWAIVYLVRPIFRRFFLSLSLAGSSQVKQEEE